MIVTVASFKGGVGKTTTAIHLSAYFQQLAPTLLIDGDANRSALSWSRRGSMPFMIVDERQAAHHVRNYTHLVIDTEARPARQDLKVLAEGCDLLVIPATPDALSMDALMLTITALKSIGARNYRILLTMVPPRPSRDGDDAREILIEKGEPVFTASIPRMAAFTKASLDGVAVYDVQDPRAQQAWAAYQAVGKEILR